MTVDPAGPRDDLPSFPPDLQLFSQALTASVHSVVISDVRLPDMPVIYVNPAFERLSGYPASEIIGHNCRFLQGQDLAQPSRQELREAIEQGRSATVVLRNYRLDGTLFCNELTISPIRGPGGTVTHYVGFQTDVTQREEAAALMTRLQDLTQTLAATRTQDEVCDVILSDALNALGGTGGAVLLVEEQTLTVAAQRGETAGRQWRSANLREPGAGADALRSGTPLLFHRSGALEAGPGAPAQTVSAVLPLTEDGQALGLMVLEFRTTHDFTPAEHHFLLTLASQGALSLGRVQRSGQLERQVRERTAELQNQRDVLQAFNEELEAFAYSVSHDLRTPVRHIISFGDLLRRSLAGPLGQKTERYLGIIQDAAHQLDRLIDGMLDLSSTSRQPLRTGPVDLDHLLDAVRHELTHNQPPRPVVWHLGSLPTVPGDADLLRQVVRALLDNALKFTRMREPAVIEVWAEDRGASWVISVRDNGVGFDPHYSEKLFAIFQRLHHREDFEGAGVGLPNARRIVARHGGTMFAEGQPGAGATFHFTLPKTAL
ncbi:ATP-binding protein [Deinococcus aerophilus]|uniref:histidine kinase n=1 Tax=Deinococcus aerophilus TaxID=522488 RepID=A0ABQ2H0Y2_9DEIO|nr:ATP-binding protein [Deinococcus aerophilus]GGM21488.1 hypothetical protein GCM10010841_31730 [Deinococcus aerophilus]